VLPKEREAQLKLELEPKLVNAGKGVHKVLATDVSEGREMFEESLPRLLYWSHEARWSGLGSRGRRLQHRV
jgi:hypothetical protein